MELLKILLVKPNELIYQIDIMKLCAIIIDDDPIFIKIETRMMAAACMHDHPISFANGREALDYLKAHFDTGTNYLVFLNIRMPVMDGWEFLDAIREEKFLKNLHIFIATSSSNSADKVKAKNYPFIIKFLEKPISRQMLLEIKTMEQLEMVFNNASQAT